MFGLLQVYLLVLFAEGSWADTREKEGSSRSSITSLFLHSKTEEKACGSEEGGLSGFELTCVSLALGHIGCIW